MKVFQQQTISFELTEQNIQEVFDRYLYQLAANHYVNRKNEIIHIYDTHPHKGDDTERIVGHVLTPLRVGVGENDLLATLNEPLDLRIKVLASLLKDALEERKRLDARHSWT